MRQEFQVRITHDNGEEEVNCFSSYIEAMTVYNDRLSRADSPCEMKLIVRTHRAGRVEIEVLAQHTAGV